MYDVFELFLIFCHSVTFLLWFHNCSC